MTQQHPAPPRRRLRRALWVGALGVLTVLVLATAWVGLRTLAVKSELEALVPLSKQVTTALGDRDVDALALGAEELASRAARSAELSGDPIWRAFEVIPVIGPNLSAVRVSSQELDAVARAAVTPLVTLFSGNADDSDHEAPGGILTVIGESHETFAHAADVLKVSASRLDAIDIDLIVAPLADGVISLRDAVDQAAPGAQTLADLSQVLPGMLGADAPRSILLMLQNPAELRSGGGITGTFALLSVTDGDIELVDQLDSSDFRRQEAPIVSVPESTTTLFGDGVGRFVQNTTMTADFALSGSLATTWWADHEVASSGSTPAPDAVLSIDPIVLRSLMAASGPTVLSDGSELSADNLVQRVLVDPYMTLDPAEQDIFFEQTMAAVLGRFTEALSDPLLMVKAFAGPAADGRISMWSADPTEQAVLSRTPLGGAAARQTAAGDDAFAVYFNDATGGKMNTFMDTGIGIGSARCAPDGGSEVQVVVTLTNTAPNDAGTRFPPTMTGGGWFGTPPGEIGMNVSVSAPPGSYFGGVMVGDEPIISTDVTDGDFSVSATRINLQPGETKSLTFTFVTAGGDGTSSTTPTLLHTPMVSDPAIEQISVDCT